jgi:hypothetical protein
MNVYLSGPMTGIPNYNFPAFDYAAAKLREEGHEVFSPADNDRKYGLTGDTTVPFPPGVTLRTLLGDDMQWICSTAEVIALLPGWEKSKGATAEKATGDALGLTTWVLGKRYVK